MQDRGEHELRPRRVDEGPDEAAVDDPGQARISVLDPPPRIRATLGEILGRMSENADLLRRAVDAYNRRDVDALLAELDPEVEWAPALPGMVGGDANVYRGAEGIRQMFDDLFEVLDEIHFSYDDVRDLGDRVITIGSIRTRGKASGAETTAPYVNVAELRDGKGIRLRGYLDVDEALRDAGV